MLRLREAIVELYRKAATLLPADVVSALQNVHRKEKKGSNAALALSVILGNISGAVKTVRPLCQDTGVPVFFVRAGYERLERAAIALIAGESCPSLFLWRAHRSACPDSVSSA